MNKRMIFAALAVATIAIGLYVSNTNLDVGSLRAEMHSKKIISEPQEATDQKGAALTQQFEAEGLEENTSPELASNVLVTIKEKYGFGLDPMIAATDLGIEFTEEEIAEYNRLHVIPFVKPDWQSSCQQLPHPKYEMMINKCVHTDLNPTHPFREIELAELEDLAHSDPVASIYMAERVEDEKSKVRWYLRAGALSEKSGPIMTLAERHFIHRPFLVVSSNGELVEETDVSNTLVRAALEQVGQKMSDPRAIPDQLRSQLAEIGGEMAPRLLEASEVLANQFLSEMAQIQIEVTGSSQIQEIIDE